MDFVANLTQNTIVKKIGKSVNICQTCEQMYSGTVFIETRCISFWKTRLSVDRWRKALVNNWKELYTRSTLSPAAVKTSLKTFIP